MNIANYYVFSWWLIHIATALISNLHSTRDLTITATPSLLITSKEVVPALKKQQQRRNESIRKLPSSLNVNLLENCEKTLLKQQPFEAAHCCLSRICNNASAYSEMRRYFQIKEYIYKLCSDKIYLAKEQSLGCTVRKNIIGNLLQNNENAVESFIIGSSVASSSSTIPATAFAGASSTLFSWHIKPSNLKAADINDKKIRFKNSSHSIQTEERSLLSSAAGGSSMSSPSLFAKNFALQFLDVPRGDDMRIDDIKTDEDYLLFDGFSNLMEYLLPAEFPADLIMDVLQERLPFKVSAIKVFLVEVGAIIWLLFWAIVVVAFQFVVTANVCCRKNNQQRLSDDESISLPSNCVKNSWGVILHILLIFFLVPIILLLMANEQISKSLGKASNLRSFVYQDVNTFIRNSHMQISFVTTSSMDITIEAIRKELEDLEDLIGKPYQIELATETGIDIALLALDELKFSTAKVTNLVADLINECTSAQIAASLLQDQLQEIARQLTIARQQCSLRDRNLCFTLQFSGFNVDFSTSNFTKNANIIYLNELNKEKDFNSSIDAAHLIFEDIPKQVLMRTASSVGELKSVLSKRRTEVYKATHSLDILTTLLSERIRSTEEFLSPLIQKIIDWDLWRWFTVLGLASSLFLIWGLLLCGAPCGCGLTSKTVPFLMSGIILAAFISIGVWCLGAVSFLLGSHGQSILCHPLYEAPHYDTLKKLLDSGGIFYHKRGIFGDFVTANDSLSIETVLKNCQRNKPVYSTFHLHNYLDINKTMNYKTWDDLFRFFANFSITDNNLEILSPTLQLNLQLLSSASCINLAPFREQFSQPIMRRDLRSFADQLSTVARQLYDSTSVRKIDNIAYLVRKVINNELSKMSQVRQRIIYKITTLEVMLQPLNKQTNQSLSHLKTIQYFLDNQGWRIASKVSRKFIAGIECSLQELYNHVVAKVTQEIGKCSPLWQIFHTTRFYVCKLMVDPMNGISAVCFFILIIFIVIAPVVIKLMDYYEEVNGHSFASISHRRSYDGLIIDEEGTWVTPSSTPPEAMRPFSSANEQAWASSRSFEESTEGYIPPPPRPPATISTRVQSPRLPRIPSMSRLYSPKRKFSQITSRITGVARNSQIPSFSRARSPKRY